MAVPAVCEMMGRGEWKTDGWDSHPCHLVACGRGVNWKTDGWEQPSLPFGGVRARGELQADGWGQPSLPFTTDWYW